MTGVDFTNAESARRRIGAVLRHYIKQPFCSAVRATFEQSWNSLGFYVTGCPLKNARIYRRHSPQNCIK